MSVRIRVHGASDTAPPGGDLLLEDSTNLLLEDSANLLLE